MKLFFRILIITCGLLTASTVLGESAYIIDQLLVGLHKEKDINSPISKVLGTGTEVEIISREDGFAKIRELEEGNTGWVDASYLMQERPAKLQLLALEEKIKDLENHKDVQTSKVVKAENEEKVSALNKQIEDLTQNLSSEKLKAGELEAIISQQEKRLAQMEANGHNNHVTNLENQNSRLQNQQGMKTNPEPAYVQIFNLLKHRSSQIALAVVAVAAFLFGRRWEDKKIRKRHGGFRV